MRPRRCLGVLVALAALASGIGSIVAAPGLAATAPVLPTRGDNHPATTSAPRATLGSGGLAFTLVWSHTMNDRGAPIAESSPMVATLDHHGTSVVVGDRAGYLYAYHLADGSPVAGWPVWDGGEPIDATPSVAPGGPSPNSPDSVFVAMGNARYPKRGGYEAYGPTGQLLWKTIGEKDAGVQASLTVGDLQDGTDLFGGTLGHLAYALDATSGSVLPGWPAYTADTIFSTAAVGDLYGSGQEELVEGGASHHGTAFGVTYQDGGHLRILSGRGQLLYDYNTDQEVDSSPAVGPFLPGGSTGIVVGTGHYYPAAATTGQVLAFTDRLVPVWSQTLDGCTGSSPALVNIGGQLDVAEGTDLGPANCGGTKAGSVYLLDGQTGNVIWDEPVTSRVIGSVVAADLTADGQPDLLVPTIHGVEVLTDAGQEATVLAPYLGFQNAPLITDDPNGTVGVTIAGYNGNNEGVIQHYEILGSDGGAVGSGATPTAGTWPMFHHDTSLTGTSGPLPGLGTLTPAALSAEPASSQVTLSWTGPTTGTVTGYNVYEGTAPGQWGTTTSGDWTPVNGTSPVLSTNYTVQGLSNGTKYYFMVTATNTAGEGSPSNEVSAVPKATQSSLSILSTSGIYGTPLPLRTGGGSDNAVVSYTVDGSGSAGCSVAGGAVVAIAAGACTITATMAGNAYYQPVASSPTRITIARAPTTTVLRASRRLIKFRHEHIEVLAVRVLSNAGTPMGTVTIFGTHCRVTLERGSGRCTLLSKALGAGPHKLAARYGGGRNFAPSRSTVLKVFVK